MHQVENFTVMITVTAWNVYKITVTGWDGNKRSTEDQLFHYIPIICYHSRFSTLKLTILLITQKSLHNTLFNSIFRRSKSIEPNTNKKQYFNQFSFKKFNLKKISQNLLHQNFYLFWLRLVNVNSFSYIYSYLFASIFLGEWLRMISNAWKSVQVQKRFTLFYRNIS